MFKLWNIFKGIITIAFIAIIFLYITDSDFRSSLNDKLLKSGSGLFISEEKNVITDFFYINQDQTSYIGAKVKVRGKYFSDLGFHKLKDQNGNSIIFLPKYERSFELGKEYTICGQFTLSRSKESSFLALKEISCDLITTTKDSKGIINYNPLDEVSSISFENKEENNLEESSIKESVSLPISRIRSKDSCTIQCFAYCDKKDLKYHSINFNEGIRCECNCS